MPVLHSRDADLLGWSGSRYWLLGGSFPRNSGTPLGLRTGRLDAPKSDSSDSMR